MSAVDRSKVLLRDTILDMVVALKMGLTGSLFRCYYGIGYVWPSRFMIPLIYERHCIPNYWDRPGRDAVLAIYHDYPRIFKICPENL